MTVHPVNFLQAGLLTLTLFGLALTWPQREYRMLQVLLALVTASMLFNLLEEVGDLRQVYLVTPIFLLGVGPAIYLTIRQLTGQLPALPWAWHFLPMLAALPVTHHTQWVIAVGTLSRLLYALLSVRLILRFHQTLQARRSDAEDLSLNWLAWLIGAFALLGVLDLIRLNLQPYISLKINLLGQTAGTAASLALFAILIYQAVQYLHQLQFLRGEQHQEAPPTSLGTMSTHTPPAPDNEIYRNIFQSLQTQLNVQHWYRQPRLTLLDLSQLSGLQTRDISRSVNLCTGLNFNDYINRLRVEEVKRALSDNADQNLLSLALEAGFNAKSSFNTAFKKHLGMTPTQYKQSLQS
ncbi:AraC family transcriptional regulator [Bowmanella dokdonensis]|uniref:AraC family transcriptional regulator n=1 Tax=Bowmanella dokdonensis TaxID=751969 RepID=A0A939ITP5_9ALTE|nr:helix-turn-helix domain-containing protein [Bowmanella dokdonensis]MBN7827671.1 AraC family transcriptional regulator [Bowmanella dokdonensis]